MIFEHAIGFYPEHDVSACVLEVELYTWTRARQWSPEGLRLSDGTEPLSPTFKIA